ncbi:gamma-glutamyltranspeptidase 1-like protein [Labeo rohita]|uniref:Gamma-glutamyltranspeptidase 1-like protein n=1 Tax=Labeo rohita TaxID=84645 RepID=A0A498NWM8_LABRO|nr:gamma-glutamyltranspeptidase 1-like protein [Labeo rohita]
MDPGRVGVGVGIVKSMMSEAFADNIRGMIKDDTTRQNRSDVKGLCDGHGTSHLSVLAEDGSAVAVTSSINNYFGSGVMSPSTGIIFNDQMCDFSDPNSVIDGVNKNNLIKPGKRPLSSKCPTIILEMQSKQVKMVVGGAGGTNITTATAQVILNYLFFDYDLQKAVKEPRVQVPINVTNVDPEFDKHSVRSFSYYITDPFSDPPQQSACRRITPFPPVTDSGPPAPSRPPLYSSSHTISLTPRLNLASTAETSNFPGNLVHSAAPTISQIGKWTASKPEANAY